MKLKNDDDYFEAPEPTAFQIIATWFTKWPWRSIFHWCFVILVLGGLLLVAGMGFMGIIQYQQSRCTGDCKLSQQFEQYDQCKLDRPEIGEHGCILIVFFDQRLKR